MQARTKIPRKPGEVENKFKNQMEHLWRSCKAFDAGDENEAERIAHALRVLIHNTPKSHAVLAQLNVLQNLAFVDSGVRKELLHQAVLSNSSTKGKKVVGSSPATTGLVVPGMMNGRGKFVAPLTRKRFASPHFESIALVPTRTFDDWWLTPFIESTKNYIFSRANIILIMANQDGGSHVDPLIDAEFSDFCQDTHGISLCDENGNFIPLEPNIVYSSIRQIAFEFMATIDDFYGTEWVKKTNPPGSRPKWQQLMMPTAIIGISSK